MEQITYKNCNFIMSIMSSLTLKVQPLYKIIYLLQFKQYLNRTKDHS